MKALVAAVAVCVATAAAAQAPTGSIAGRVTDPSGNAVDGAAIIIADQATGQRRAVITTAGGTYAAAVLPPGIYTVTASAAGFKRHQQRVTVEAGTTTTVDVSLAIGDLRETIIVSAAAPVMMHEEHTVSGIVTRDEIEAVPLNGRNFLDLAKLEPGVAAPVRGTNNRQFVASLGAGLQSNPRIGSTRTTIDGANVSLIGTIGAALQVSQEAVREFQVSTVNFDPAAGPTTNGAVNVVTRSGSNRLQADGFAFYRDHRLAAYPGLRRDPRNPDPYFQRRELGTSIGGPLERDRAFLFACVERDDQRSVVTVEPATPEFASLGGVFPSPSHGNQLTARVDARLGAGEQLFVRHSVDSNRAFGPSGGPPIGALPSAWSRTSNRANQSVVGLTSIFSPNLVNDARVSLFSIDSPETPADANDCPGCIGVGGPLMVIPDAGLTLGQSRTLAFEGRRIQAASQLTWNRGSHRIAFGLDWERSTIAASAITLDPAQLTLWAPARVRQLAPAIPLPGSFTTVDDILRLPLQQFQTAVGPGETPQRGFRNDRVLDLYRVYGGDTWHVRSALSVNAGVAWSVEPRALNNDLSKPELLAPLVGPEGLRPPGIERFNIAPRAGFAWTIGSTGRTVVRGGIGRYFDPLESTNSVDLANERAALLPLGTTRLSISGANYSWNGQPLDFRLPTGFTGADLMAILPAIRAGLSQSLRPGNRDFSIRNIDRTKYASNLFVSSFSSPRAVHLSLGIQRELGQEVVVTADVALKNFRRTTISGVDLNHWSKSGPPVLRRCQDSERDDVSAACSNGPITFDISDGHARYRGLLIRLERRFSAGWQLLTSYALGSYVGTNGTGSGTGFTNLDPTANVGPLPTDVRHQLNVAGAIALPWAFRLAWNVSASSAPPFSVYVGGVDFDGDGTSSDLLPGTHVNQFGRGMGKADLAALVDGYNQSVAGTREGAGALSLPRGYTFNDNFCSMDVRLSHTFSSAAHVSVSIDVFNLFNTANLVNYSGNIANPATFGQPGARFTQVFGSGGPRAAQIGLRIQR